MEVPFKQNARDYFFLYETVITSSLFNFVIPKMEINWKAKQNGPPSTAAPYSLWRVRYWRWWSTLELWKGKKKMPIHFQIKISKYQLRRSWQMYIKEKSRFYSQTVEKVINLHNRFPYVLTVSSNIPDLCVWRIKHFALCYSVFFGVSRTRLKNEKFEIYFHVLIVTDLWTWSNLGIKISLFDINKLFQQG